MAKFNVGDRIRYGDTECIFGGKTADGESYFAEVLTREGTGWSRDSDIPEEYKSIGTNNYWFVQDDEPWELVTPTYTKIEPKVGEKYRVLKRLFGWYTKKIDAEVNTKEGCVVTIRKIYSDGDFCLENHHWSFHKDCLTTEYLELVKEPEPYFTVDKYVLDELKRPLQPGQIIRTSKEFIEEPKQTIMNKLTSALKRVLSKEKQTLYKVGLINGGLDLSATGREAYLNALFQNEGDHAKAMAEMVEMAEEELKDNED